MARRSPAAAAAGNGRIELALQEKLGQQEEVISQLRQQNGLLQAIVKRKDATIEELTHSAQNQSMDRSNKTGASSKESDVHLRDREVAVLRRKNRKMQQELEGKKRTVSELLQTITRLNALNCESSAAENDDEDEGDDSDDMKHALRAKANVAGGPYSASPQRQGHGFAPPQRGNSPQVLRGGSGGQSHAAANRDSPSGGVIIPSGAPNMAAMLAAARDAQMEACDVTGDEEDDYEVQALAEKLARLEGLVSGLGVKLPQGEDSPPQQALSPSQQAWEAAQAARGQAVPNARAAGAAQAVRSLGLGKAVQQSKGLGPSSQSALDAVTRELAKLEEQKRIVEQLAKMQMPEDDDDDDGFPLR